MLDLVLGATPEVLVAGDRVRALRKAAAALPPNLPAGLEVRLGRPGRVDLQQRIDRVDAQPATAARRLARMAGSGRVGDPDAWRRIATFCRAWGDPATPWAGRTREVWLELDIESVDAPVPAPAVVVGLVDGGLPPESAEPVVTGALDALLPEPVPQPTRAGLRRVLDACPAGGVVSHVGAMISRPGAPPRLNVGRVPADRIAPFLSTAGWPGAPRRLDDLLDRLVPLVDHLTLALDLGPRVGPRLGLECALDDPPARQPRWAALFERLVELDCATAAECEALLAWPQAIDPTTADAPWPAAWVISDLTDGRFSAVGRRLSHVKLDLEGETPLRAKAYLGFFPLALEPRGGRAEREALPPASAPVAPGEAVGRALEFLAGARTQSGLWRDWDAFEGGSDETVSCIVGAVLAESGLAPARSLAKAVWRVLATRSHPAGGWGYSAIAPPDADSTAWGLRLAVAIGAGGTDAAGRARDLLLRQRGPGAGLRTYVLESYPGRSADMMRGWTAVHTCVTAGAALLPGPVGEGALEYLRRTQRADGRWDGYWWDDDYTTALAARALAERGGPADRPRVARAAGWAARRVASDGAAVAEAVRGPSTFAASSTIATLSLGAGDGAARDALDRAVRRLLGEQLEDGSWAGTTDLRKPPFDALAGEFGVETIVDLDERRVLTTALALAGLVGAGACLEVRGPSEAPPGASARRNRGGGPNGAPPR